MDVFFLYRGLTFVWDGMKAVENRNKHGVSFETACEPFFDQLAEFIDASVDGESRLAIIGLSEERKLLYVVHVEPEGKLTRIISARLATEHERKRYANSK